MLLVARLALRDIRHRAGRAFLLLVAIAAGVATLTLALALRGTTDNPYARTRAATGGPDVVAKVLPGGPGSPSGPVTAQPGGPGGPGGPQGADPTQLEPLEHAAGVSAYSGPFPLTWTHLTVGNTTSEAQVEGRDSAPSRVDDPKLVDGGWVRPGGVVVEAGFASVLGIHVGDALSLGGVDLRVVGTAVTAGVPTYGEVCTSGCFIINGFNPGLVWATMADTGQILQGAYSSPVAYLLNLKLADPAGAPAFAARYDQSANGGSLDVRSWQSVRDADAMIVERMRLILLTGSWLLALLAVAGVAVLVGGRMTEQTRRVGLLKAVGGTPEAVAAVLLFEHLVVGAGAAAAGLVAGLLAAPVLDKPGAGLLGAPGAPSLTASTVVLALGMALAVAAVATFVPALRAARQSTVAALEDRTRAPRRRAWVIRLSAHLPAPLLLGVRLSTRRPRRLLLTVFSVAVTASGLVAILVLKATTGSWSLGPRVTQATTIVSVMLVVLAGINAAVIAWTTAIDARRTAALARALGATPAGITAGISVSQLLPSLAGALLGVPGGIAVYDLAKRGGTTVVPSALPLAVVVLGSLVAVGVLTAIPARIGARRPVAEVLQAETA